MNDLLHAPGFLGTNANLAADATLIIMLTTAILFSIGFYLARKHQYNRHKWVQTTAAVLNVIMVLWMMILPFRDFVILDRGGPRETIFYGVTAVHAIAGLCATIFGTYVVLRGYKLMPKRLSFHNYKPYMRTAYALYITATLLGVGVYLIWFVFTASPPTF